MTDDFDTESKKLQELCQNLELADITGLIRDRKEKPRMAILIIGTTLSEMNRHLLFEHHTEVDLPPPAIVCLLLPRRTQPGILSGFRDFDIPRAFGGSSRHLEERLVALEDPFVRMERDLAPMIAQLDREMLRDTQQKDEFGNLIMRIEKLGDIPNLRELCGKPKKGKRHYDRASKHPKPIPPPPLGIPRHIFKASRGR